MGNDLKLLHSKDIKKEIETLLMETKRNLILISAFVRIDVLKWIDSQLDSSIEKKLLVRFQKRDLVSGATDFEIVNYCLEHNWKVRFNLDLHSKIFLFDDRFLIVGSANATKKGLSLTSRANIETAISGEVENVLSIYNLFNDSYDFNQKLLKQMLEELLINQKIEVNLDWTNKISKEVYYSRKVKLTKADLLNSKSPSDYNHDDLILLGCGEEPSLNEIRDRLVESKFFIWVIQQIKNTNNQEIYFGELTKTLHDELSISETISRSEVKTALGNILNWIEYFDFEEIKIDKPSYSQRISYISNK